MPLYEFDCETCGSFEKSRPMSESAEPMLCPNCQAVAKRIYSVAGLIATPSALSRRIEKSAEPQVVQKHSHREESHTHHHHHNHTHGRPWMVGH